MVYHDFIRLEGTQFCRCISVEESSSYMTSEPSRTTHHFVIIFSFVSAFTVASTWLWALQVKNDS